MTWKTQNRNRRFSSSNSRSILLDDKNVDKNTKYTSRDNSLIPGSNSNTMKTGSHQNDVCVPSLLFINRGNVRLVTYVVIPWIYFAIFLPWHMNKVKWRCCSFMLCCSVPSFSFGLSWMFPCRDAGLELSKNRRRYQVDRFSTIWWICFETLLRFNVSKSVSFLVQYHHRSHSFALNEVFRVTSNIYLWFCLVVSVSLESRTDINDSETRMRSTITVMINGCHDKKGKGMCNFPFQAMNWQLQRQNVIWQQSWNRMKRKSSISNDDQNI